MFYIIFSFKLSQSKNKIILPTFANIHCVKNQSKPRKCPPNYVPWPSNNRAFIIINVKINNNHALFYYIYMGNRLWKYKSWQISIFKKTISGVEGFWHPEVKILLCMEIWVYVLVGIDEGSRSWYYLLANRPREFYCEDLWCFCMSFFVNSIFSNSV